MYVYIYIYTYIHIYIYIYIYIHIIHIQGPPAAEEPGDASAPWEPGGARAQV